MSRACFICMLRLYTIDTNITEKTRTAESGIFLKDISNLYIIIYDKLKTELSMEMSSLILDLSSFTQIIKAR